MGLSILAPFLVPILGPIWVPILVPILAPILGPILVPILGPLLAPNQIFFVAFDCAVGQELQKKPCQAQRWFQKRWETILPGQRCFETPWTLDLAGIQSGARELHWLKLNKNLPKMNPWSERWKRFQHLHFGLWNCIFQRLFTDTVKALSIEAILASRIGAQFWNLRFGPDTFQLLRPSWTVKEAMSEPFGSVNFSWQVQHRGPKSPFVAARSV